MIPTIKEQNPDVVIIHVGSNNVNYENVENFTSREIAENIIKVAEQCRSLGVEKVVISSVLIKKSLHLGKFIRNVNIVLEELCIKYNFYFINNDNIFSTMVSDDCVHLKRSGYDMLLDNFINFIDLLVVARL